MTSPLQCTPIYSVSIVAVNRRNLEILMAAAKADAVGARFGACSPLGQYCQTSRAGYHACSLPPRYGYENHLKHQKDIDRDYSGSGRQNSLDIKFVLTS